LAVAKSVAASSLTKAAIFGHDPNWGRIACAAGYSGAPVTVCGHCWYCCIATANHFK
jgi:N-acetylglutamate synthase/N-acetylornithine aminotransferase